MIWEHILWDILWNSKYTVIENSKEYSMARSVKFYKGVNRIFCGSNFVKDSIAHLWSLYMRYIY